MPVQARFRATAQREFIAPGTSRGSELAPEAFAVDFHSDYTIELPVVTVALPVPLAGHLIHSFHPVDDR